MSRRSAPDSPWQNGVPPFALCQPSFNPMMNCNPMWGQSNVPFMGNMMTPNMMRYGDSSSSRSNFRRNYDQKDRRFQQRRREQHQPEGNRRGNKRPRFSPRNEKRPGLRRSRSPPAKRVAKEEDKVEEGEKVVKAEKEEEQVEAGGENQECSQTEGEKELYDPADPTNDAGEEATDGKAEGDADDSFQAEAIADWSLDADSHSAAAPTEQEVQEYSAVQGNEGDVAQESVEEAAKGPVEGEEVEEQCEDAPAAGDQCKSPEKQQTPVKSSQQIEKDDKVVKKNVAEEKSQNASKSPKKPAESTRKTEEKSGDHRRGDSSSSASRKQKGKGWCTVCELNFEGSFLDHRRTDNHKRKRDQKYPKCHPCSMGFANSKQYDLHCSGNFHKKNVEVQDNEIDEKSGPLGVEYLEETTAFFCSLCHVLLKPDIKDQHCRTRGHYRRHRDAKRKEEASRPKELSDELKEKGEDDDAIFTITDEIVSDDEGKGDSADRQQPTSEGTTEENASAEPPVSDSGVASDSLAVETAQPETATKVSYTDDKPNGDAVLETSVEQSIDEEMAGYKTADEATPDKAAAASNPKAVLDVASSTPKPSGNTNRGRARGPIGRGRAIRGRRR